MSDDQSQRPGVLSSLNISFLFLVASGAACAAVCCVRIDDGPTALEHQQLLDEDLPCGPIVSAELDVNVVLA